MSPSDRDQPRQIDHTTACSARMYDYILGGRDNFRVDRERVEQVVAVAPHHRILARGSRALLGRVVTFLADEMKVRQFLDIGSGLPTADNVHQIAHRIAPDSRVVYVDKDPLAVAHGRSLLSHTGNVSYIEADLRDPAGILEDARVLDVLDFSLPIAVLMVNVLQEIADEENPDGILRDLREALAPGSFLAIAQPSGTRDLPDVAAATEAFKAAGGPFAPRSHERIESFFGDFRLVEPGLVHMFKWRPTDPNVIVPQGQPPVMDVLAGVARKPK